MDNNKRYGTHKATGVDVTATRRKPAAWRLEENYGGKWAGVVTVPQQSYAVIVHFKKKLLQRGVKPENLRIVPIW